MIPEQFGLGQAVDLPDAFAAGVVDVLLVFLHAGLVFFQSDQLLLRRGVEEEQILQDVLVDAVAAVNAVFEGQAKALIEGLVLFPVVLEHGFQLGFDLLLKSIGDEL